MSALKHVKLITDGSCLGNPGPGGWACILRYGKHARELYGSEKHTTNNRMELTAACMALEALNQPCQVTFYTDSQYVQKGISEWLPNWVRSGWRTASKKPVLNQDLWQRLHTAAQRHKITWKWVKGHANNAYNNRVDELATAALQKQRLNSSR